MTKLTLSLLVGVVLAAGTAFAATGLGDDGQRVSTETGTTRARTTTTATREAGEDVRGPCDEAEHASDPRCARAATTTGAATTTTTRTEDDDLSGPCDEAEHRNDPRCTGARATDDDHGDDRGGRGGDDDDRHGGHDDDRSGSNSGRG